MLELKIKDQAFSKNLLYFHNKYGFPGKQIALNIKRERQMKGKKISSGDLESFLLNLKT